MEMFKAFIACGITSLIFIIYSQFIEISLFGYWFIVVILTIIFAKLGKGYKGDKTDY